MCIRDRDRNQRLAFEAGWWGVDEVDETDAPPLRSNSAGVYPIYLALIHISAMRLKAYLENLGVCVCLLSMDNFFLPLDQRPPEAEDWESPYLSLIHIFLQTMTKNRFSSALTTPETVR